LSGKNLFFPKRNFQKSRLEEGEPPKFKGREPDPDGWDKMIDYYTYLRSRDFKNSI
jgi:hypothetical protein